MPVTRKKLSPERSEEIRSELKRGSYKRIAEAMDVDVDKVRDVLRGKVYDDYGIVLAAEKLIAIRKEAIAKKVNEIRP